jgi:hypothetical protein
MNNRNLNLGFFAYSSYTEACAQQQPNYTLGDFQLPAANLPVIPLNSYELPTMRPLNFQLHAPEGQQYSLFGQDTSTAASPGLFSNINAETLDPARSTPDLYKSTMSVLLKLPSGVSTGLLIFDAAKIGYDLNQSIQKDIANGMPSTEAYVCQITRSLTENGLNTLGTDLIIAGIPGYLAGCVEVPALAVTIPVVGTALPHAFHNVGIIAKEAGNYTEQFCHDQFSAAKKIARSTK